MLGIRHFGELDTGGTRVGLRGTASIFLKSPGVGSGNGMLNLRKQGL